MSTSFHSLEGFPDDTTHKAKGNCRVNKVRKETSCSFEWSPWWRWYLQPETQIEKVTETCAPSSIFSASTCTPSLTLQRGKHQNNSEAQLFVSESACQSRLNSLHEAVTSKWAGLAAHFFAESLFKKIKGNKRDMHRCPHGNSALQIYVTYKGCEAAGIRRGQFLSKFKFYQKNMQQYLMQPNNCSFFFFTFNESYVTDLLVRFATLLDAQFWMNTNTKFIKSGSLETIFNRKKRFILDVDKSSAFCWSQKEFFIGLEIKYSCKIEKNFQKNTFWAVIMITLFL